MNETVFVLPPNHAWRFQRVQLSVRTCSLAFLFLSAGIAVAGEPLDNTKIELALKAGISSKVMDEKIKSSLPNVHVDASLEALVRMKQAAEEGKWSKEEIGALQEQLIKIADGDKKRLADLVTLSLSVFENADPSEYEIYMRKLKKEGKAITPYMLDQIEQESERKRGAMLDALGQIGDKSDAVVRQAILMLTDRSKPVRLEAAKCIAKLSGPATCDDLIARLAARDEKLDGVCMALGYLGDSKAEEPLTRTLKFAFDSDTRVCAAFALGQLRSKSEVARSELLNAVLDEHDEKLRDSAANSLALIGDKRTPSFIKKAFQRYRPGREEIIKHLSSFKTSETVEFLLEQLENDVPKIKRAAQDTLQILTGETNLAGADEWKSWWEVTKFRPDWIQVDHESKIPEPGSANKPSDSDPITTTR